VTHPAALAMGAVPPASYAASSRSVPSAGAVTRPRAIPGLSGVGLAAAGDAVAAANARLMTNRRKNLRCFLNVISHLLPTGRAGGRFLPAAMCAFIRSRAGRARDQRRTARGALPRRRRRRLARARRALLPL